jgi:hypothetical protein
MLHIFFCRYVEPIGTCVFGPVWTAASCWLLLPIAIPFNTEVFPKVGQVTRNASFIGTRLGPKILHFCSRLPRILQIYLTSRLALQISFGLRLGILRYSDSSTPSELPASYE